MRVAGARRQTMVPMVLALLWVVALAAGAVGVVQRLMTGHELSGYTSTIPWGLWVAAYVYLIGLSAGAFLLSTLIYVFGVRRLEPVGKLALFTALVCLLAALLAIWMDLGHMGRFYEVYTRGNPRSMMAWMVWLYTAYSVLLVAELWFALRGDLLARSAQPGFRGRLAASLLGRFGEAFAPSRGTAGDPDYDATADLRVVRVLGAVGVPLAIAFHGGVGALFGVVGARGFWNAPLYPLMFLVGALVSGGGLLTFIVAFFWPERDGERHRDVVSLLGRITLGLLALYALMVWAEYSITLYAAIPASSRPLYQVLGGPYPWVFWVFQVLLGTLVPAVILLARPRSVGWVGTAAFLVAASFLATRLNIVIPGLVEPQLPGLDRAYIDSRLTYQYFPSVMEWLVLIFVAAVATGLFYAGFRGLPLVVGRKEVSS